VRGPISFLILLAGIAPAVPADIPFRIQREMIQVEAGIAGADRPMNLIVESGTGETILAERTADDLGGRFSRSPRVIDRSAELRTLGNQSFPHSPAAEPGAGYL
jgi:hypothetical protein